MTNTTFKKRHPKVVASNLAHTDDSFGHEHSIKFKFPPGNALKLLYENFTPLRPRDSEVVRTLIELKQYRPIKGIFNHGHIKAHFDIGVVPIKNIFSHAGNTEVTSYLKEQSDSLRAHHFMEVMPSADMIFSGTSLSFQKTLRDKNASLCALLNPIIIGEEIQYLVLLPILQNKKITYAFFPKNTLLSYEMMYLPMKKF